MGSSNDLEVMLGDPKKAIKSMMVPLMISYLVCQINTFADTSWCAGLGADASAAVSCVSPIYWIIAGIGTGIGVGASVAIARYLAKTQNSKANSIAEQSIVLSIIAGLITLPILWFLLDPMLSWMNVGSISGMCRDYIDPAILFAPVMILNGTVAGLLRAEGAAKKSMFVLLSAAVINIVLDPILIYAAGMGLSGAAYATVIATTISTVIGLHWYVRKKLVVTMNFRHFRIKTAEMKEILLVGVPRATEYTLISVLSLVQRVFLVPIGGIMAISFYNLPWQYVSIVQVISQAAGAALIPVCSAALAQNNSSKAETGYRYATKVSIISMTILAVIIFIFAEFFMMPFTVSETMIPYREEYAHALRIYALLIPFMGLIDIGSSILQSMRMAQMSMVLSFVRNILLIGLLCLCTTMDGVYWSLFAIEVFGGTTMMGLAVWEFRKYKRHRLLVTA